MLNCLKKRQTNALNISVLLHDMLDDYGPYAWLGTPCHELGCSQLWGHQPQSAEDGAEGSEK